MARVEEVTGRTGRGSSYHCPVPEHDDRSPSLSINPGENQPVVFECHAGCGFNAVLEALGISTREFFGQGGSRWAPPLPRLKRPLRLSESTPEAVGPEAPQGPNFFDYAERVCHYDYEDESGELALRKIRWRKRAGAPEDLSPKCFTWQRLEAGRWKNGLGGHEPRLYRQARVAVAAPNGEWIFLVEGEKDVESVERLELVATTGHKPGALTPAQARALERARVVIIPDNDSSGQGQAQRRRECLEGIVQEMVWLELPIEKDGGDVTDWIEAGGTASELIKLVEAVRAERPTCSDPAEGRDDDGFPFPEVDVELTDRGIAIWSQHRCGQDVRYNVDRKLFMRWEDHLWSLDVGDSVVDEQLEAARDHLRSLLASRRTLAGTNELQHPGLEDEIKALARCEKRLGMAAGVNAVTTCWRRLRACQVHEKDLDSDLYKTLLPDGLLVDLNGDPRPARREDLCTKRLGVPWGEGEPVLWLDFLSRITSGDQELANYIECALGYSIYSGRISEQIFFFAWGEGSNGKSTLMNVGRGIAGDYGFALPKNALTVTGQQNAAPYIAMLPGRRLVTVEEVDAARLDESLIKQLTGGEPIVTRNVYERAFEFMPQCKLWMCGNKKLRIVGTDHGIWRRVRLIPFLHQLDQGDRPVVPDYHALLLKKEGPQIAARLFAGAQVVNAYGLPKCTAVQEATREYREEEDYFGRFFEDCLINDPDGVISTKRLVQLHREWVDQHGYDRLNSSSSALGTELRARGYTPIRHLPTERNQRGWSGLRPRGQ